MIVSIRTVSFIIMLTISHVCLCQKREVENLIQEFIVREFNACGEHTFIEFGENYFFEFENLDVRIKKSKISKAERVTRIQWKGSFQVEYDLFRELDCDEKYQCISTRWRSDSISHLFKYAIRLFDDGKNEIYPLIKSETKKPNCQLIESLSIVGTD